MTRNAIVCAAAILLAAALIHRFHRLGGPYFEIPETLYDHVSKTRHQTVDSILLARRSAPFLPRGATVTMFRPSQRDDTSHFHTAVGLLHYQRVLAPPKSAQGTTDFVITVREPFHDPAYRVVARFPEGNLYARR